MSELSDAIIKGDFRNAKELTESTLAGGATAAEVLNDVLIPAMDEVGARYEKGEYFVPQLLMAGRAMEASMAVLSPALAEAGTEAAGRVVIGTVKDDQHDIGKNLVATMLEGGGFEVIDLGVNVKAESFIEKVKEKDGTILCMSALLTTTMPNMKEVIDALDAAGLREKTKVMVGGAPVTQEFADKIGADGYSENASGAVNMARTLVA